MPGKGWLHHSSNSQQQATATPLDKNQTLNGINNSLEFLLVSWGTLGFLMDQLIGGLIGWIAVHASSNLNKKTPSHYDPPYDPTDLNDSLTDAFFSILPFSSSNPPSSLELECVEV